MAKLIPLTAETFQNAPSYATIIPATPKAWGISTRTMLAAWKSSDEAAVDICRYDVVTSTVSTDSLVIGSFLHSYGGFHRTRVTSRRRLRNV